MAARRLKRVAHALCVYTSASTRTMATLATEGPLDDAAGRAVSTAIVSIAMLQCVTYVRSSLLNIALAGLGYDAGRPRLASRGELGAQGAQSGGPTEPVLDELALDRMPASAAFALSTMMPYHAKALARVTTVFEAHWLLRSERLGLVYRGRRPPSMAARVVALARRFVEARAAARGTPVTISDTLNELADSTHGADDRACLKLLGGALGMFPVGTNVKLNTGELGVVMNAPDSPLAFARPFVNIVCDRHGHVLDVAFERDLREHDGVTARWITSAVRDNTVLGLALQEAARSQSIIPRSIRYDAPQASLQPPPPSAPQSARSFDDVPQLVALDPTAPVTPPAPEVDHAPMLVDALPIGHRPTPVAMAAVSVLMEATVSEEDDAAHAAMASFPEGDEPPTAPPPPVSVREPATKKSILAREARESRMPPSRRDPRSDDADPNDVVIQKPARGMDALLAEFLKPNHDAKKKP